MGLGGGYYLGTGQKSVTALIPAFVGLPLVVLGLLALREKFLKHAMHGAAALGLLGFVGGAVMAVIKLVTTGELGNTAQESAFLAVVCAGFVALCVRSFVMARRRRGQLPPS
jgi:hypothetical protein